MLWPPCKVSFYNKLKRFCLQYRFFLSMKNHSYQKRGFTNDETTSVKIKLLQRTIYFQKAANNISKRVCLRYRFFHKIENHDHQKRVFILKTASAKKKTASASANIGESDHLFSEARGTVTSWWSLSGSFFDFSTGFLFSRLRFRFFGSLREFLDRRI